MLAAAAIGATLVGLIGQSAAQTCGSSAGIPLIDQSCPWPYSGPEQIDTSDGPRGLMQGINLCNQTTQNQQSECVNSVINNISDFCIFAPPTLNFIANAEGETVSWCTKSGYGTRLIPAGTITGLQVVRTPGYLAFGMLLNQQNVDVYSNDTGGELDPHGADGRGNPIGSLVYSNAFGTNGSAEEQITEWHEFIGSNMVCMKICDPSYTDPNGNLCLNIYDTVGCNGNVPLDYGAINGTFQYCQGDNQQVPNGSQLPIPATSSCTTYASSALFTGLPLSSGASSARSSSAASMTTPAPARNTVSASIPIYTGSTSTPKSAATAYNSYLQSGIFSSVVLAVAAAAILL